jgi:hypothetical protein
VIRKILSKSQILIETDPLMQVWELPADRLTGWQSRRPEKEEE